MASRSASQWDSYRSGRVSVAAGQERVPHPLPIAALFPDPRVERRSDWRAGHGSAPWLVLRRLLLGADVVAVGHRRDEFALGGGHCCVRARRKTCEPRSSCWPGRWTPLCGLGCLCPGRRLLTPRRLDGLGRRRTSFRDAVRLLRKTAMAFMIVLIRDAGLQARVLASARSCGSV